MQWIYDGNNNRASVEYWGSEERAREALATLNNCSRCSDCSGCSDCSRCSRCSDCSGCSGCSGCSRCSDCSGCSDCSRCSDCSGCSRCSDCSGCSDCSRCSDCSDCSGCSRCSGCSGCSDCSRCSDCSDCSGCSRCSGCSGCSDCSDKSADGRTEKVAVPVVADLHKRIYEAVAQPDALDMSTWHTCNTTHCRAGWVVTLAGAEGRELEKRFDTPLAAMMIYDVSCPGYKINPCRFYDTDEEALEDMRKLAEGSNVTTT